jgi:UDP-N-acetylmuramate dehydrogenase
MTLSSRLAGRDWREQLIRHDIGPFALDVSLANHNSWQIGGPADLLVEPDGAGQVATVVRLVHEHQIPLVVIGQGTNLLFDDAGLRGVVLKLGENFSAITIAGNRITAESGAWVPGLAHKAMRAGLAGLEHAIGIPGTIGGLVLMNGGSQRKGIGENVCRVKAVTREGETIELSRKECAFSYRSSALQGMGAVVVEVELECERCDPRRIRGMMLADLRERRTKFPRKEPNCGSVFLSTGAMHQSVGPPGKIIEEAGLKGKRIGKAEVSCQHANFIVNRGGASSAEVLALIDYIRRTVKARIDFDLDCEVRYVSPSGVIVPAHLAVRPDQSPSVV